MLPGLLNVWGTLPEVHDMSEDLRGVPGRVGVRSQWSWMVRGTSGLFGTGRETIYQVQDDSGDPRRGRRQAG